MALASVLNRKNIYWQIVDLLKNHACITNYVNLTFDIVLSREGKNYTLKHFSSKGKSQKLGLKKTKDIDLSFTNYKIIIKIS